MTPVDATAGWWRSRERQLVENQIQYESVEEEIGYVKEWIVEEWVVHAGWAQQIELDRWK